MKGIFDRVEPSAAVMPVPLGIVNPMLPIADPRLTVTVQVVPLPVTPVTLAPVLCGIVRPKFDAVTPVMLLLKVTVQESDVSVVM